METTRIAFVRDHSGSMCNIAEAAAKDFNAMLDSVREGHARIFPREQV